MAAAVFQNPIFQDETKAREALESVLWPDGPVCRHCGNSDPEKIAKMEGKSHRAGLYYCNECGGQFTVTVGTVFERSKVPLTKWWMAAHMINSGKNGVSAHEIHRTIGVTYKTAWFMMHRLREAMSGMSGGPMGGEGQSVQADETYYGNSSKRSKSYKKGILAPPAGNRPAQARRALIVRKVQASDRPMATDPSLLILATDGPSSKVARPAASAAPPRVLSRGCTGEPRAGSRTAMPSPPGLPMTLGKHFPGWDT